MMRTRRHVEFIAFLLASRTPGSRRELRNHILSSTAVLMALAAAAIIRPVNVRTADGTYQLVKNWAQLPPGTQFGVMSAVATDSKGNVYAFQRDEPSKVIVFDTDGKLLKSWGENEFPAAHGLRILRDGSIWLTDRKLQQVLKFSLDGKLLMAIGTKGVAGDNDSKEAFNGVSDVVMAENGNVFVADGEGPNTRVVKVSKDGKFIKFWGTKGAGPGELNIPHSIAMDSKGRVYVADRTNKRIQVFDQDGKYLDQMTQFGVPTALFITRDDILYVAAGAPDNQIAIGTTDGKVFDHLLEGLNGPHGIAVDSSGAIYVAETGGKTVLKFIKK